MNIFSFLTFISSITFIGLIIKVMITDIDIRYKRFFAMINIYLFLWAFGWVFTYSATDIETAYFWYKVSGIGFCMVFGALLHFVIFLTCQIDDIKKRILTLLIHLPGILFTYGLFADNTFFISGFDLSAPFAVIDRLNFNKPWLIILVLWMSISSIISVILIINWGKRSAKNAVKKQARAFAISLLIPLFFGLLSNLVINEIEPQFPATDPITNVFFGLGLWYSIVKYRFMINKGALFFDKVISSMSDFLILVDEKFRVFQLNKRAAETFYNINPDRESDIASFIEAPDYIRKELLRKENTISDKSIKFKAHFITKLNNRLPVQLTVSYLFDKFNDHIGYMFYAYDLSPKLELEARNTDLQESQEKLLSEIHKRNEILHKLSEAEQQLKNLGDNLPGGAIFLGRSIQDKEFELKYISENVNIITGFFYEEFYENLSKVLDRIHPDDKQKFVKLQYESAIKKRLFDFEFRFLNTHGNYIWIKLRAFPRIERDQLFWDGILMDISDRKEAENKYIQLNEELESRVIKRTKELREAKERLSHFLDMEKELNDMKTRFINLVFHEFRTPLTIVHSSAEIIKMACKLKDETKIKDYIERITGSVIDMNSILSYVSKFQSKNEIIDKYNPTTIDISDIIKESLGLFAKVEKKEHVIQNKFDINNQKVKADPNMLVQVIGDLLSNAVKFSPAGSTIIIEGLSDAENVKIFIKDSGCGIDKEDLPHIFEPFYKSSDKIGLKSGIGLGLSIVKNYIEIMNGSITIESELNKGTTATIRLPKKQHILSD